jgi:predicted nucleic acid-binding protein
MTTGQALPHSLVVDNSVMIRWLFNDGSDKDRQYAQKVLTHIKKNKPKVIVPCLWLYESSFVVNFYTKKKLITVEDSIKYLDSLFDLCRIIRGDEKPKDIFIFANENNLSAYDASYVMLALQQKAPLATLDKAMIKAAKKIGLDIFYD